MQRFITMGQIPEIRTEPHSGDYEIPEVEVLLPVEVYWELQALIQELRYARVSGQSKTNTWRRFNRLVTPYVMLERDRLWFKAGTGV